ncbi:DUF2607 family protein [Vibrio salinus]|uniref:DUF2607 family protein n=1 Tax=Vibrio salinus TaxID=2899784 RepID=UPI003562B01E
MVRQSKEKTLACLLLILFICLSFAAELHKIDINKVHHQHHNCNQFANVVCAITPHTISLPIVVTHSFEEPLTKVRSFARIFYTYCVRSPPIAKLS